MKDKPTKEQVLLILHNLSVCMVTGVQVLKHYGNSENALQLDGARLMVNQWIQSVEEESERHTQSR